MTSRILIFQFYDDETDQQGYTHLRASERPDGWLPALEARVLAHDILEHVAGPNQEIQALGAYYSMRYQWEGSVAFHWDIVGALDTVVEELAHYPVQHNDLFRDCVLDAILNSDLASNWQERYGDGLVNRLVENLSRGYDEAERLYGSGPEAFDHFKAVEKALEAKMSLGGTFYIDLETYETEDY